MPCFSPGDLDGVAIWSVDAWPGSYAVLAWGGVGEVDNNTVVLGVSA